MDKSLKEAKKKLFSSLSRKLRCEPVIQAMERVPRERFVPPESRHMAYLDVALGIGEGQTISQPYIVALMIKELGLLGHEKVLEIGTGRGYQAAILSALVPQGQVVSVELIPVLEEMAGTLLKEMGYDNVEVRLAGPVLGCPERGPYDAIIVSAASPKLPEVLVSQLAWGGRLVIPVGTLEQQDLVFASRTEEGLSVRMLEPCRFVPLIGREAFPKL